MGKKKIIYSKEELKEMGLVDTTERPIAYIEKVTCTCKDCNIEGVVPFERVIKKRHWRCTECGRKSQREKVTGLKITDETRQKLSIAAKNSLKNRNKTLFEKYGTTNLFEINRENPMKSEEVKQKIKQNNLEKYGVEHHMHMDKIKNKIKQTNLEKYGVECTLHSTVGKEKTLETWNKKYGTDNPFANNKIKEKIHFTKIKNGSDRTSKEEIELFNYIKDLGTNPRKSTLNDGNGYVATLDILIEDKNIAIEYNGEFWHSEYNGRTKNYHLNKTLECKKKGYELIHIWGQEWTYKKDIVKNYIKSRLGLNTIKVMARKCEIREISKKDSKEFLNNNHLQGYCNSIGRYGLYYNDELICIATVSNHHRGQKDVVVLSRFCTKGGVNVAGGLSKLSNFIKNKYNCKLITWVDLRLSSEKGYITAGWKVEEILKPDYFYFDNKKGTVISKQSRQKRIVNTPEGMTEYEHAKLDGLFRVWDCGKVRLYF